MFLEQRFNYFSPPQFNQSGSNILGTRQQMSLDRTWPIEEIVIHVGFVTSGTMTLAPGSATTPDGFDNVLQILQRITLAVNDGKQPRNVVDLSGVAALEYAYKTAQNLDSATLNLVQLSEGTSLSAGAYQITYRIPLVNASVDEPLRSRMYLPVHTFPQDPILYLQFNTLSGMGMTVGSITNVYVDVQLVRRVPTVQSERVLQATAPKDQVKGQPGWGYIPFDLIETPFSVAPGIGTEQRFQLPVPGQYISVLFRHYLGGAALTRNVIDGTGIGDTIAHGFGSEQRWRLETGSVVIREWRWKHLRAINDWSNPRNNVTQSSSPAFSGAVLGSTNFQAASSCLLNFLTDGCGSDVGSELGSLLDCNTPAQNGLKMEVIGTPASVATNGSYLYAVGHRLFGDLSRWQTFS